VLVFGLFLAEARSPKPNIRNSGKLALPRAYHDSVRDIRRQGEAATATGTGAAGGATPGKRTLMEVTRFGVTSLDGDAATTPLGDPMAPQGDPTGPTNMLGGNAADGAVQNGGGSTKTTVSITESTAPPLTFNAKDYKELYAQVSARVGKEAGEVTRSGADITTGAPDGSGNIPTAAIKYDLATMLPAWPQKASQPQADQAKFDAWRGSVSDHEKGHRDIYKRELVKERQQVIGPKQSDIDTQIAAVEDAAEKQQDAWDAAGQPAPLAVPGGIEKVGDASDDMPPSDTAMV
jgi:hypothetical protein